MTDTLLSPKDNNFIDSVRKLASFGVFHNFMKNTDVIAFNSALANTMARQISEKSSAKVSWQVDMFALHNNTKGADHQNLRVEDITDWLEASCCGYYFMVDYNVFFELEEDRTSFILRFSS